MEQRHISCWPQLTGNPRTRIKRAGAASSLSLMAGACSTVDSAAQEAEAEAKAEVEAEEENLVLPLTKIV